MSEQKLISLKENPSKYVKINVGGSLFSTTIATLTKYDSMLRSMFSGEMKVMVDSDGYVLIDRCGENFGKILNFLRTRNICLNKSEEEITNLLDEAKFYCIQDLVLICENFLNKEKQSKEINSIILSRSQIENENFIKKCIKPVILLTAKMSSNNSQNFQNFNNNIDLFENYSLDFGGLITFMKYVPPPEIEDVCSWKFYKNNKLLTTLECFIPLDQNSYDARSRNTRPSYVNFTFPEIQIVTGLNDLFYKIITSSCDENGKVFICGSEILQDDEMDNEEEN